MEEYTDETIMPKGKYEGKKLANVSARYLMWMYDNYYAWPALKKYIEDNKELLQMESKQEAEIIFKNKQERNKNTFKQFKDK